MRIAILGCGTVGSGTAECLKENRYGIEIAAILDKRNIAEYASILTDDIEKIVCDKTIELVVETMGGISPAYEWTKKCLQSGKHVVTANKQLVSTYYEELNGLAVKSGVVYRYTPSVGGGIPWLYNLRRQKRLDTVTSIYGIVNGTTNYIIDSMERNNADFCEALADAQAAGYAEIDPSSDIDGIDSCRKCAISATEAFDLLVSPSDVDVFGIRNLRKVDVDFFKSIKRKCRLVMSAFIHNNIVRAYVEPCLINSSYLEYGVLTNNNLITMDCKNAGRLALFGQGAGKYPTGCAVAGDIVDIICGIKENSVCKAKAEVNNSLEKHRYYIRTTENVSCGVETEKIYSTDGNKIILTKPLSVKDMHEKAKEIITQDSGAFIAAYME